MALERSVNAERRTENGENLSLRESEDEDEYDLRSEKDWGGGRKTEASPHAER
jgi:hypothetical protein